MSIPSPGVRRAVTVPTMLIAAVISVATGPLWGLGLLLIDLVRGGPWRSLRCGAALAWLFLCESAGILASGWFWFARAFGRRREVEAWQRAHFRLQCWWGGAILAGVTRVFGLRLVVEGHEQAQASPQLLFLRHASLADSLLPAVLVSGPFGVRLRYVLKRELLWDPCLDIVGNRMPNHFVDRQPDDREDELEQVRQLARDLAPGHGVVIFPEGTRFTEAKRERILQRLRERGPHEQWEQAASLRHVLPPRPGGPLALIDAAPHADVVFCAHTGFEGTSGLKDLWDGALVGATVRVRFTRVPAAEVPTEPEARRSWLLEQWAQLDAWIGRGRGA
jgi:1-acyl-sn-glycerol-3-phosphate acyltransferase